MSDADAVTQERGAIYGHPYDDFMAVQSMFAIWKAHQEHRKAKKAELSGLQPALDHAAYMIFVKLARLAMTPDHRDSLLDIQGYAKTYEMCLDLQSKK